MSKTQVAICSAHVASILLVPCQHEILVVVSDGLFVVAETVMGVAQEVTGFSFTFDIVQFL